VQGTTRVILPPKGDANGLEKATAKTLKGIVNNNIAVNKKAVTFITLLYSRYDLQPIIKRKFFGTGFRFDAGFFKDLSACVDDLVMSKISGRVQECPNNV